MRPSLVLATLGSAVLVASLSGCRATAALDEQEVVVHFRVGTALSAKAQVAQACAAVPEVSPEPLPASADTPQARLNEIRFRVDRASTADVAALYRCLRQFPTVIGAEQAEQ